MSWNRRANPPSGSSALIIKPDFAPQTAPTALSAGIPVIVVPIDAVLTVAIDTHQLEIGMLKGLLDHFSSQVTGGELKNSDGLLAHLFELLTREGGHRPLVSCGT